ncbi:MAG: prepilin-type N-terminal cleavage/methylation domain-containing protein [Caldimicrobium sp.]
MNFKRKKFYEGGYTLIEVLLASLIFSVMVYLATFALDQGLKQYQGILQRGLNFWEDAKILWLQRSLSSSLDYYVYDERKKWWYPFFKGRVDLIAYVSLAPFSQESPVLVVLKKENTEKGYNLVYYELPVFTSTLKEIENILAFEEYKKGVSFVFFKDLESLNFKYYGYDRFRKFYDWFSEFEGSKFLQLPSIVKIEYIKEGNRNFLYGIINVQNFRKSFYNEFYLKY